MLSIAQCIFPLQIYETYHCESGWERVCTLDTFSGFFFFQNDISEEQQRWGAKTVQGSGHQESLR